MKLYFTLTRAKLVAVIAFVIAFILIIGQFSSIANTPDNGKTNVQRLEFIRSLGIDVEENCESSKEIVIPVLFSDVYTKYNALQKQAGYDLSLYKGCKATVFTYKLKNSEERVNIIVVNGKIIGGDIATYGLNGEMKPLK